MQQEIRVSVEEKKSEPEDLQRQEPFKQVIDMLEGYISAIKQIPQTKIDGYLEQLSLTTLDLVQSLYAIITSFKELNIKSRKYKHVASAFSAVWQHILAFLMTKNLQKVDVKGKIVWLIEVETKIACSASLMHDMKILEDITNSPKESFQQVWQRITIVPPKDEKLLKKHLKKTKKMLHVAASAVLKEQSHQLSLIKVMSFGLSFPRYMIMNDSAKLQSFKFYRTPTIQIAQKFWNLPESGATKELIKIVYQGITTKKNIFIPPSGQICNRTNIFTENSQYIKVRILYSKQLHIFAQGKSGACCFSAKEDSQFIDTVLIHMHGGGFIALSSRSTQSYTRKWANQLNVPIFSIDYRMPPNHTFPTAPLDCLTVYKFLINHIHKFMNIRPTNIYISGDSAGGNLACSLTGLILREKLPIPRGIYVAYPAVDLRLKFTLSRVYALTDVLLWPSMLLLCLNSYLNKDFDQAENPLASPVLFTEQFVNEAVEDQRFPLNWPKTIVTAGSKDPLLDDSLLLMQKMVQSKIQCECFIYEGLSHGYLSTDQLIQQTQRTIVDSIEHLRKLMEIEGPKKKK